MIGCYGNICCWFFVGWKSKCDFLFFFCQHVLRAAQQNCTKHQHFYSSNGRRYWMMMMPEVLKKKFLSHVQALLGSEVKSLKKVKKLTFFKYFFCIDVLDFLDWTPVMYKKSKNINLKNHLKKVFFHFFQTFDSNGAHTWDRKVFSIPQASSTINTFHHN